MKAFKLLARLMGRQTGGVVPLLYARAINQPLLVEPGLGEALIQGYLAADNRGPGDSRKTILHIEEGIAVIEVAGALVARDIIAPCEESPTSYEAIGRAHQAALDDPAVETIFFRFETPGGESDACFDLVDQIYASRGQKKMIAIVDRAYSAGYALASACDEIWVSRTSGVGSVGVVTFHVDQSALNERVGIKVEYIQAGARKTDFSPHKPLSDEARGWMQAEIDRLYGLFVDTVARNRGLTAEQVRATEAGCYFADGAVAAKLADKVGTFAQAVTAHSGGFSGQVGSSAPQLEAQPTGVSLEAEQGSEEPEAPHAEPEQGPEPQEPEPTEQPDPAAAAAAAHLAILEACTEAGTLDLAAGFIKANASLEDVRAKLDLVGEIKSICAAAGMPDLAAGLIATGASVEAVRSVVLAAAAARDTAEISSHIEPKLSGNGPQAPTAQQVYEQRRKATQK